MLVSSGRNIFADIHISKHNLPLVYGITIISQHYYLGGDFTTFLAIKSLAHIRTLYIELCSARLLYRRQIFSLVSKFVFSN